MAVPVLRAVRGRLDHRRYNGASLLGLRGIVIKSHGSADGTRSARRSSARSRKCATACRSASPSAWRSPARSRGRPPCEPNASQRNDLFRIAGTGSYLPPRVMTNADFAARCDTSDAWIRERTGIERHIAEKSRGLERSRLGSEPARAAGGRRRAEELDLIVVATSTPDYVFPSTACLLQAKLGVKGCAAFDVQAVCSGFVYGLATADTFIGRGNTRKRWSSARKCSRASSTGTTAAPACCSATAPAPWCWRFEKHGIHASVLRADGSHSGMLSVPGNVCGGAVVGSPFLQMNGQAVFKFAVRVLESRPRETVAAADMRSPTSTG